MPTIKRLGAESKTQHLYEQLRELAYQLEPGSKFPTAVELCAQFSTNRVTLNDALDILEAQRIIYRRRGSGVYVSPEVHTKCICVLLYAYVFLGSYKSPFWGILLSLIAQEIEQRSATNKYRFEFHFVLQQHEEIALPESLIEMIREGRIHGVLTVGMNHTTNEWIHQQGIPCVSYAGGYGRYLLTLDTSMLIRQAVSLLAEAGCTRLGMWMETSYIDSSENNEDPSHMRMNEQLFRRYLNEYGLSFHPALLCHDVVLSSSQEPRISPQQQGYRRVMEVFGQPGEPRPDGLFIDHDMVTAGALIAFQELGIQVGKDVQLVSHAIKGSPILFGHEKYLKRVEFDPAELAHTMFLMLDSLLVSSQPESIFIQIHPYLRLDSQEER